MGTAVDNLLTQALPMPPQERAAASKTGILGGQKVLSFGPSF
jgi:hypothetical protein